MDKNSFGKGAGIGAAIAAIIAIICQITHVPWLNVVIVAKIFRSLLDGKIIVQIVVWK